MWGRSQGRPGEAPEAPQHIPTLYLKSINSYKYLYNPLWKKSLFFYGDRCLTLPLSQIPTLWIMSAFLIYLIPWISLPKLIFSPSLIASSSLPVFISKQRWRFPLFFFFFFLNFGTSSPFIFFSPLFPTPCVDSPLCTVYIVS